MSTHTTRVLVVDDDVIARALLKDLLEEIGIEVTEASGGSAALSQVRAAPDKFALVITDLSMPAGDGIGLARELQKLSPTPPVVFYTSEPWEALRSRAESAGVAIAGFLPKPLVSERIAPLLSLLNIRPVQLPSSNQRSPTLLNWPFSLLFLAWRQDATCQLQITQGDQTSTIGLKNGRICSITGVPQLFASIGLGATDLSEGINAAIAAGQTVDRAFIAASEGLGHWLIRQLCQPGHITLVAPWSPPPGTFPLSTSIPRLLADGLRSHRSIDQLARSWTEAGDVLLHPTPPEDLAESRWGLDPVSLRILRQLSTRTYARDLLQSTPDPTRRLDLLRALDLLFWLNMIRLAPGFSPSRAQAQAPGYEVRAPQSPAPEPKPEPRPDPKPAASPAPEPDPQLAQLKNTLTTLQKSHPAEILELSGKKKVTEEECGNAFRDISRRYHPDFFYQSPPAIKSLAEACFSAVTAAYELSHTPAGLADINRFLDARANNVPYVAEKDHLHARVAFRKGEIAWRNRDWAGAEPLFEEAFRLDPVTWPHALYRQHVRYLTKKSPYTTVIKEIEQLTSGMYPGPRQSDGKPLSTSLTQRYQRTGELLTTAANILKLEGKLVDAQALYARALEADPDNRDAQREARNQEKRTQTAQDEGWLGKLFKR